jgi:hypothetical protein
MLVTTSKVLQPDWRFTVARLPGREASYGRRFATDVVARTALPDDRALGATAEMDHGSRTPWAHRIGKRPPRQRYDRFTCGFPEPAPSADYRTGKTGTSRPA